LPDTIINTTHHNPNSDTPSSAPAEWKFVDEAYLNFVVETEEGYKLLTGLKGDDVAAVANIIDEVSIDVHLDISGTLRCPVDIRFSYYLC
jgi:hypothetical protein